jgi:hypothetical protein
MKLLLKTVLAVACIAWFSGCVATPKSDHWSTRPADGPDMGEAAWAKKSLEMEEEAKAAGYLSR